MADGSIGIWIGNDLDVGQQLRWALRLAEARQLNLVVYEHVDGKGNESQALEVSLNDPPGDGASPLLGEVRNLVESSPRLCLDIPVSEENTVKDEPSSPDSDTEQLLTVRLKQIRSSTPREFRELMIAEARTDKLKLLTMARKEYDTQDAELVKERRLFLRYSPCEVVFCFGLVEEKEDLQIAVGVASGVHGSAAIKFARDISKVPGCSLIAARVNPDIGPDSQRVGARRLDTLLGRSLGTDTEGIQRRVVKDNSYFQGMQRFWEASNYDLIIMGASRVGLWGSRVIGSAGSKLYKADKGRAVIVVSAGAPIKGRFAGAVESKFERLIPQIERENRIAFVERVQSNSNWDFDFIALMVLSTTIAAIGLVQDSSAVVIGAMLVAPLMTPLLGLGLALVQGNIMLVKISVRSVIFGIGVALLVGFTVGLAIPGFDQPSAQMLARGGPTLLDLFVAFASGLAAAYASSRPGLLAALPGVAIAAALVPPIATSGLALSQGNIDLALKALLLFGVNMFTIIFASYLSLLMVGFRSFRKTSRPIIYIGGGVIAGVLALAVILGNVDKEHPVSQPLPSDFAATMQRELGDEFQLEGIEVVYEDFGVQLNLRVAVDHIVSEKPVSKETAGEIRTLARKFFKQPVQVRLISQNETGIELHYHW